MTPISIRKISTFTLAAVLLLVSLTAMAAEKPKKIKPKVRMSYYHYSDTGPEVHVNAYYKPEEGGTSACTGAILRLMNSDGEVFMEKTVDKKSIVKFGMKDEDLAFFEDTTNFFFFAAELDGGDTYRDGDSDLEIWASALKAEFSEEDSIKTIQAVFEGSDDSGRLIPIEDALLKFYVKRLLFPLPVGGEDPNYTNSKGQTGIEFPGDLPGDKDGNLIVMIQLEEDDRYGTVVHREELKWGTELHIENHFDSPSLISPGNNAPWFMVIGINAALIAVWGAMLWVVLNLFRIKKIGKKIAI